MKLYQINENVALDAENVLAKNGRYFARLICIKPFICHTMLINENKKGAYIEVGLNVDFSKTLQNQKNFYTLNIGSMKIKPLVEIGEKTWLETYDMVSKTVVEKGSKVGSNVLIGPGCNIGKKVLIEDKCHILYGTKILKNSQIGQNSEIGGLSIITENSFIKQNCKLGDNVFVGYSSNHYDKYWRTLDFDRQTQKYSKKSSFTKTKNTILGEIKDLFNKTKATYIGENVQIDRHSKIYKNCNIGNNVEIKYLSEIKTDVPHNYIGKEKEILEK